MNCITSILILLVGMHAAAETCKWGLSPDYKAAGVVNNGEAGNDEAACRAAEQAAASRMMHAKKICFSSASGVSWNKTEKDAEKRSLFYFQQMRAAMSVAAVGYTRVYACERADLVAKFEVTVGDSSSLEVTDADSGDPVFQETRSIHDTANDLYRLSRHFQDARAAALQEARKAARAQKAAEEERAKYDEFHHPTLGVLRFPKTMSQEERSAQIAKMELDAEDSRMSDEENYLKVREEALSKKSADLSTRSDAFELRKKVYTSNVTNFNQRCANGGYLCESDAYTLNKEHDSIEAARVVLNNELEKFEQERRDLSQAEADTSEARRKLDSRMAEFGMKPASSQSPSPRN